MINPKDISVVVQGAVGKDTRRCLRNVRRYLPGAELILSTWVGTDVSGLDYDKLVLNEDPGAIIITTNFPPNNVNRQLVSTQAGLKEATRKYTLKLRTDLFLQSTAFMKYFDKFNARDQEYSIFQHRVMISSVFSREQYLGYDFLFHPSDFWFFGLTTDICDYWLSTPLLYPTPFSPKKSTIWMISPNNNNLLTYTPEQWVCINWVKRHLPKVVFDDYSDDNPDAVVTSKNVLYNNFIFVGPYQSGIWSRKHRGAYRNEYNSSINHIGKLITYDLFQKRYKELCDKNYVVVPDKYKYLYKIRENLLYVFVSFKYGVVYFICVARLLYYIGVYLFYFLNHSKD